MILFCSNNELITYYSYNCLVTVRKPLLPHLSSSPCAAMTISSSDCSCRLLIVVLGWVVAVNGVVIVAPLALLRLLPCRRCRQVPSSCRPSLSLQSHHYRPPFFVDCHFDLRTRLSLLQVVLSSLLSWPLHYCWWLPQQPKMTIKAGNGVKSLLLSAPPPRPRRQIGLSITTTTMTTSMRVVPGESQ